MPNTSWLADEMSSSEVDDWRIARIEKIMSSFGSGLENGDLPGSMIS
jgi:hypothetical protein